MKKMSSFFCATSLLQPLFAQQATVTETVETVKTYPFSDPDPVADPSDLFYPYFRFDGFSAKGINRQWKVVSLENDYIKLTLFPEIGGKIWGAVDKTTGKEFIYNNHVVKFRDIADAWSVDIRRYRVQLRYHRSCTDFQYADRLCDPTETGWKRELLCILL